MSICYRSRGRGGWGCMICPHFRHDDDVGRYCCFMNSDNNRLLADAEKKICHLKYEDVLEKSIVEIFTDLNEYDIETKYIHYMAYGYCAYEDSEKDHRFLEYTWFVAPLQDVLDYGVDKYESEYGDTVKQYIEDCTKDKMFERYVRYDSGKCPLPINKEKLEMNVPDGLYILI